MPRTKRRDDDDGAWRPSDDDFIVDDEEEMLDDDVEEEKPKPKKTAAPSRASPARSRESTPRQQKKTTHKTRRQEDEAWKPTDEDIEDEELEVQEMANAQLLGEELAEIKPKKQGTTTTVTHRKKPAVRRKKTDDDWDPAGDEEGDEEEEEDEEEPADEEPASHDEKVKKPRPARLTPTKKPQKRPASSSAGSPTEHKKPGPVPKHRLTSASNKQPPSYLVQGQNDKADFVFTVYRGEGMCMLAMNWKNGTPPDDFVGFTIEYREPKSTKWWAIPNYMTFPGQTVQEGPDSHSSRHSPIQRFRWVHFPYSVDTPGHFHYRVTPCFMKGDNPDDLTRGEVQEVQIQLMAETYPGKMNVAFTRGFVSSKAFGKKFGTDGGVGSILPAKADEGLEFKPADAEVEEKALSWMGFEAREVLLGALDAAIEDKTAQVRVLAYDLNNPEVVLRLQKLGRRLRVIIDDSDSHAKPEDAESKAADMLARTAGKENVQRQHVGSLQHNKVVVVDGDRTKIAIGGSTNMSWRGLYVQNNNLVALQGAQPVEIFSTAFDNYWDHPNDTDGFYKTASSQWADLGLGSSIDAQVTFSPHSSSAGTLDGIAADIKAAESSLFYSLAFLYETPGVIRDAIEAKTKQKGVMVYGLSDKSVGGLDIQRHDGNPPVAYPEDFDDEAAGGSGARMHHKFVVIDFDRPTARVYTGSHNFSNAADTKNGENLFLIRDQRVATAYMIEAVAMFDHYEVRDHVQKKEEAKKKGEDHKIHLRMPPQKKTDKPWWDQYWTVKQKINDREMFGK